MISRAGSFGAPPLLCTRAREGPSLRDGKGMSMFRLNRTAVSLQVLRERETVPCTRRYCERLVVTALAVALATPSAAARSPLLNRRRSRSSRVAPQRSRAPTTASSPRTRSPTRASSRSTASAIASSTRFRRRCSTRSFSGSARSRARRSASGGADRPPATASSAGSGAATASSCATSSYDVVADSTPANRAGRQGGQQRHDSDGVQHRDVRQGRCGGDRRDAAVHDARCRSSAPAARVRARQFDTNRSFVERAVSFPENIEVEATHTFTTPHRTADPAAGTADAAAGGQCRFGRAAPRW